ncbi:ABC transporter substrate-binding protein [Shewanella violacea]|uniref:Peptide ABC transporter, periplasmic peptide-binding protein n=1 Tax=Shewanella violacea (strain JCM 10179 / CIP 106290 / LMG 19151 / DSS12) TaxID=637905 RepID=D4ZAB2_SHEVD|nr:ABC transporter substrate-binding protein [Shewanella violacea]BAJ02957.1 peptide ABC transporter, periplasmic peptide-binding protein [Shewanella violacea DSS12]
MRMLLKRLFLYPSISCFCVLLAACGPKLVPPGIVYCSEGNPESFNPQLITSGTTLDATSQQIYNGLVDYDINLGQIEPSLATDWQISDDELTYTFQLRRAVNFHHTTKFTPTRHFNADDVLFSFNRVIDPSHPFHHISKTGYPFFQSIGFDKQIESIEKLSDHEVAFHLKHKDASFLANLASGFSVILSAEYADTLSQRNEQEKIDREPVGTGPFQLVKYVKNDYIRYHRNEGYWGHLPTAELLVFDITPKSTSRLAKLITGDCSVSALPKAGELSVVFEHEELEVDSLPGFNVAFWAFNTHKAPFNDVRVRKALAHAVDRDNILRAVYLKTAVKATGMLPPMSWAYSQNQSLIDYNPEKARQLLHEAGVENLTMDIWAMPVARIYNPNAHKTAELIQADLADIGVKVNIVSYDWSVFNQKLSKRSYDSVLIGWNADNSDPDNFFTPILSCASVLSNSNRSRWCNPKFDDILFKARSITSKKERKALYQEAEALFAQELPMLPFAHATRLILKKKSVKNSQLTPFGGISFNADQDGDMMNTEGEIR